MEILMKFFVSGFIHVNVHRVDMATILKHIENKKFTFLVWNGHASSFVKTHVACGFHFP